MFKLKKGSSKFSTGPDLIEGDIVQTARLKKYLEDQRNNRSSFDAIVNGRWTGAKVYYSTRRIRGNARAMAAIRAAIAEYHSKTCIRFYQRTNQPNYIDFFQGGGCYSMIGMQRGKQDVSLGRGCETKGVTIHEIMHALGFFHEQSRRDRDKFVTIHWRNIPSRVRYNFETYKHGQADTLGEPYDKNSVMHYGSYAFSQNGRRTISSKDNPNESLGQRQGLSPIDVRQLNKYYKCGTTVVTKKPTTNNNCKDKYDLCRKMAEVGLCKVGVAWVYDSCQKSCNKCPVPPTQPPVTKDSCRSHSNKVYCSNYVRSGYCNNRSYRTWMRQHCSGCGYCV